jgi:hypothetical protein
MSSDLPGVNLATLNRILLYYRLMTKWSGLGDSTKLSRVGLSQRQRRSLPHARRWSPPQRSSSVRRAVFAPHDVGEEVQRSGARPHARGPAEHLPLACTRQAAAEPLPRGGEAATEGYRASARLRWRDPVRPHGRGGGLTCAGVAAVEMSHTQRQIAPAGSLRSDVELNENRRKNERRIERE